MLLTSLTMLLGVITFGNNLAIQENFRNYSEDNTINGVIQYQLDIDKSVISPSAEENYELISVGLNGGSLYLYSTSLNSSVTDNVWQLNALIDYPVTNEPYNIAGYIEYLDESGDNDWFQGGFYFDFLTLSSERIYSYEFDTKFQNLGDELTIKLTLFLQNESAYSMSTSDFNNYYQTGYDNGYIAGESAGYELGDQQGYSEGYQVGFTEGYAEADNQDTTALTIFTGIINVALLPVNVFLSILNFEVFGINIGALVSSFLTIAIVVILWRIISGGKND